MVDELRHKGREALTTGQWERARELLQKALVTDKSAEVYEDLAWACWWLNEIPEVFEYRSRAYKLFIENNDRIGASRLASWTGLDYIEFKGEFAIASGWFKRAENLLEGLPGSWELALIKILKARWAFEAEKNSELAFKLIDESLALCKSVHSIEGEMLAEALKGFILVLEGKISEGMPLLDEATLLALTTEKGDVKITTITCCYLIDACERIRDFERARQWCNTVREICKRWRYEAMFASCRMKYAGVLIWNGEWEKAEEELVQGFKELQEFRPLQVNAATIRLADLKRRQGKWEEAAELFNKVRSHPLKQLYVAAYHYDKEEYEQAENMAERFLRRIPVQEKAERTTAVELLIRIYLKQGKMEPARKLLLELRQITGTISTVPIKAILLNAEGHYNHALKNYEIAKQKLEDAIDIYENIKSPYEASRARLVLSETLINLKQFSSAEKELNKAMADLKVLGAQKDFDRARYMLKNLYNEKAVNSFKNVPEFSGRELEVLRLLTEGKNNKDIADKLYLSIRTIEKHLTNIYGKLGVSGKSARAFAVSFAIKNDLILGN